MKDEKGLSLRVDIPENPFEYSIDCHYLEPLELVGLLLPALEECIGEVEDVFVEEAENSSIAEGIRKLVKGKK